MHWDQYAGSVSFHRWLCCQRRWDGSPSTRRGQWPVFITGTQSTWRFKDKHTCLLYLLTLEFSCNKGIGSFIVWHYYLKYHWKHLDLWECSPHEGGVKPLISHQTAWSRLSTQIGNTCHLSDLSKRSHVRIQLMGNSGFCSFYCSLLMEAHVESCDAPIL